MGRASAIATLTADTKDLSEATAGSLGLLGCEAPVDNQRTNIWLTVADSLGVRCRGPRREVCAALNVVLEELDAATAAFIAAVRCPGKMVPLWMFKREFQPSVLPP